MKQNKKSSDTMINVYGIKNCNKMRDTFKWMDEQKIEYQFTDVKKEPVSDEKLAEFADKVGIDVLVNKRGMKWRQLGLADKDLSEQDLFDTLLENQTMMKRPVLEKGEAILIGYDEDAFKDFMD